MSSDAVVTRQELEKIFYHPVFWDSHEIADRLEELGLVVVRLQNAKTEADIAIEFQRFVVSPKTTLRDVHSRRKRKWVRVSGEKETKTP